jgi:hypothetical protein
MNDFEITIRVKDKQLDILTGNLNAIETIAWLELAKLEVVRVHGFFTDDNPTEVTE